ncbi:MAG: hypothetical protein WD100_08600, partial [Tistlia sp.]
MTEAVPPEGCHALILAPHGRDAALAARMLAQAGVASRTCPSLAALGEALGDDTAFVVLTEEAARDGDLGPIVRWQGAQASWSDLPWIVLTARGGSGAELNPGAARLSEALGNVTFVERPFHPTTFTSVARTALNGRLRQFEARARLDALRQSEERLRLALTAGHLASWELDLASRDLVCSDSCKALYGRAADAPFDYGELLAGVPE